MARRILAAWLVAALVAVWGPAWAAGTDATPPLRGGDIPPDDLGHDAQGDPVRVSGLRGKVVVVSFWASWCGYCRKELPVLERVQQLAGKEQMAVVGVNTGDTPDAYRRLSRQLRKAGLQMALTYDRDDRIGQAYGVHGIPHLVIIDRDGQVAYQHVGYGEEMLTGIVDELNEVLAERPRPAPVPAPASPAS